MDRKLVFFISSKYVEYALFFLATISFARYLGKVEYGNHALVFTSISYAPFFLLGTNQLTLRNITIEKDRDLVVRQSSYLFLALLSLALFFCAFSTDKLHFIVMAIVSLKLTNEYLLTLARGLKKYNLMSFCYVFTSLIWFVFLVFLEKDVFFYLWSLALLAPFSLLILRLRPILVPKKRIEVRFKEMFEWVNIGYKYAIIGLYLPISTTLDRWFIDAGKYGAELGLIQFSFNLSNIVSFALGVFSFYFYPIFLERISLNSAAFSKLRNQIVKAQIGFLILTMMTLYFVRNIDLSIVGFGQYNGIFKYLLLYLPVRIFIWGFFPYNVLVDVKNQHKTYMFFVLMLLSIQFLTYAFMNVLNEYYIVKYHPYIQLILVGVLTVMLSLKSKKWM